MKKMALALEYALLRDADETTRGLEVTEELVDRYGMDFLARMVAEEGYLSLSGKRLRLTRMGTERLEEHMSAP